MTSLKTSRRRFLAASGSACALNILPSGTLFGKGPKLNDRMSVAFIGMGGQIQGHVQNLIGQGHQVSAFCDVDPGQIARSKKRHGEKAAGAREYGDYRDLLEKEKSLDAVVIATPDHWHATICKAAMEAGKHVYCEKPLTHTIAEARELRELCRSSKVVTQTGNQGSASPNLRRSMELIAADVFGPIREVHVWHPPHGWPSGVARPQGSDPLPAGMNWDFWCGSAPLRPYKNGIYHPAKWRGWYDFGNGFIGDFCCHSFNLALRSLSLDYPSRISFRGEGLGKETFARSCSVKYHFLKNKHRSHDVALHMYTGGGKDVPPDYAVEAAVKTFGGLPRVGCIFIGDKGMLSSGLWNSQCYIRMNGEEKYVGEGNHDAAKVVPKTIPRVRGHMHEWVDACMGKGRTFADFDHGGHLTEIGLAGIVALKMQKDIQWDGEAMKVKGHPEADKWINKPNRGKWLP
ncbi:MAG: Gfo/Idh/MocA family oxidoreductase [Verrucomicrobiales bacterium]